MRNEIEEKLKHIVQDVVKTVNEINPETPYTELGVNSINFIKVIVAIETEFDFEFDESYLKIEKLYNIRNTAQFIEEQLTNQGR